MHVGNFNFNHQMVHAIINIVVGRFSGLSFRWLLKRRLATVTAKAPKARVAQ